MKHARKLVTLAIVLAMVMAFMVPTAMAASDGTITLTNAAIGKNYQAYKILDATYSGDKISYTTKTPAVFSAAGSPWTVSTVADANGNYNVQLASGKTTSDVTTWIKDNLTNFTPINPSSGATDATATADELTWTGLAYGYYYITSTLGTVVSVDTVAKTATIVDKNTTAPSELKKTSNSTTAQIGDEVQFTVTFKATNYITTNTTDADGKVTPVTAQIHEYSVSDSANGFDYYVDASHPVTVTVGTNPSFNVTSPTINQQVDSTTPGSMVFTIDWDNDASGNTGDPKYNYEENVTITYYAKVNEFANDGAATNEVTISQDATSATFKDTTETNTYSLTINKTDGTNPLTGAKFALYRNNESSAGGAIVRLVAITGANVDTLYFRVAETGEAALESIVMTEEKYSSAVIYGLDGEDTYYIKEIEAPQGYNKLDNETAHKMNNANGSETIVNNAGTELPSTGGMGTTIFYILGSLMFIGAAVVLVTNKRMGGQM